MLAVRTVRIGSRPRSVRGRNTAIRTRCVATPRSGRFERPALRRITTGRIAGSARLLSNGTSGQSGKVNK